jgi:thioredoxin 2
MKRILKLGADWCTPCKNFSPIFEEVGKEFESDILFMEVDIESPTGIVLCDRFSIKSLPTILFLSDTDELIKKFVGTLSKEKFKDWIKENN